MVPDRARIASQNLTSVSSRGRPRAGPAGAVPQRAASQRASSCGLTVTPLTVMPCSSASGPKAASRAKACCGPATKRATWSGLDTAQFLGTSSPITIWTAEASSMPTTTQTPGTAPSGRPIAVNGPSSSRASAGSASMPTTREVMVIPSWVPESWKDSSLRDSTTRWARRSPAAAACSASGRSTVTRPNSAATKKPLARISRNAAARSSRGVVMMPPPVGCHSRERRRYCRTVRPSPEGVTPRVAGTPCTGRSDGAGTRRAASSFPD
ncbi:hypothetical protein STENM36S_03348 [Streptomyces tendae]